MARAHATQAHSASYPQRDGHLECGAVGADRGQGPCTPPRPTQPPIPSGTGIWNVEL